MKYHIEFSNNSIKTEPIITPNISRTIKVRIDESIIKNEILKFQKNNNDSSCLRVNP